MKAKDIMTRDVITVRPTTTVEDIAHLLTKHRIGGVPVVDDERRVVGIVTERDLFLTENGIPFSAVKLPELFKDWVDPGKLVEIYASARHHKAVEVMTPNPIFVGPEDKVDLIAWKMARYDLKRVPVLEDGLLVGFITRADIIQLLAKEIGEPSSEPLPGSVRSWNLTGD